MHIDDHLKLAAKAHGKIQQATKAGLLPSARSLSCKDCGKKAYGYDHRDYNKPLDVEPVCQSCNMLRGKAKPEVSDRSYRNTSYSLNGRVRKCKCKKCGHKWYSRKPGRPALCPNPKCHSPHWDKKQEKFK